MDSDTSIYESLNEVAKDVMFLGKNSKNEAQRFNFRGIDAVMNVFGPSLRKHGVTPIPMVKSIERGQKQLRNSVAKTVDVEVTYRFINRHGSYVDATVFAEAFDTGDKATAKAMSVAMRTAFLQVFALPTDEPDPDMYSYDIVDTSRRDEFLERAKKVEDVNQLLKMGAEARRVGAESEWQQIGKSLEIKLARQRDEAKAEQESLKALDDEHDWDEKIKRAAKVEDLNSIYAELKQTGVESQYLQQLSARKKEILASEDGDGDGAS